MANSTLNTMRSQKFTFNRLECPINALFMRKTPEITANPHRYLIINMIILGVTHVYK